MYNNNNRETTFEVYPTLELTALTSISGNDAIVSRLKEEIDKIEGSRKVVVFDYYHGTNEEVLLNGIINKLKPDLIVASDKAKYPELIIQEKFGEYITDDRICGVFYWGGIEKFFDASSIASLNEEVEKVTGLIVIYGVAATTVYANADLVVYGNLSLQTIKDRYRNGLDNWGTGNFEEEYLRKEKRFSFVERIIQDKHKRNLLINEADFVIDCNRDADFVMVDRENYDAIMEGYFTNPIKMVPIFWEGIWGGDWSKKVLGVGEGLKNTAWGITGHFDMQSVAARVGDSIFEFPANDLIEYDPKRVLGPQLWHLYGYRCPFHTNFLDTVGGGNLSLQVHPTMSYSQEVFNSPWGHYESYYILDGKEDASVYLGTKDGVKLPELVDAFEESQTTGMFDDAKYINKFPAKKHDHFFIPGGTIHSAGVNTMTLEIDMFTFATFKLWDWGRVDYDGKPRPINIGHGKHVIQEEFQTAFAKDRLISKHTEIDRGIGWKKERTGTSPLEAPMEVNRYWMSTSVCFDTKDSIILHVLVAGEQAVIESLDGGFKPMILNYAESVFIPACIGQYVIKPFGKSEGKEIAVLEIFGKL